MIAIPAWAAVAASVLLGTQVTGALTVLQAIQLAGIIAQKAPQAVALAGVLNAQLQSPAFRTWAARNGDTAILLQPGISTER